MLDGVGAGAVGLDGDGGALGDVGDGNGGVGDCGAGGIGHGSVKGAEDGLRVTRTGREKNGGECKGPRLSCDVHVLSSRG